MKELVIITEVREMAGHEMARWARLLVEGATVSISPYQGVNLIHFQVTVMTFQMFMVG